MDHASTQSKTFVANAKVPSATKPLTSAVALITLASAAAINSAPSQAGSCTNPVPADAVIRCTGVANNSSDMTQVLELPAASFADSAILAVTTDADFGINTNSGDAISMSAGTTLRDEQSISFIGTNSDEISGAGRGISANVTSGNIQITTTGEVTGRSGEGIRMVGNFTYRTNTNADPEFEISAGSVTGSSDGVYAKINEYAGLRGDIDISVSTTGTVTGASGRGIYVFGYYQETLSVNASGPVIGNTNGIQIYSDTAYVGAPTAAGNLSSITTTASVTGTTGDGIRAETLSFQALAITTQPAIGPQATVIQGAVNGIYVKTGNEGGTTVTTSTTVAGGSGAGIRVEAGSGTPIITLQMGSDVSSTTGPAIENNNSDSTVNIEDGAIVRGNIELGGGADVVTIETGAMVTGNIDLGAQNDVLTIGADAMLAGDIQLGLGTDNLTFQAADVSTVGQVDGDTGINTLRFEGSRGDLSGDMVTNWQTITLSNNANINFIDGTVTTDLATVNMGSTLGLFGSAFTLEADLDNFGTVSLQDDATDDAVTVDGDYDAGSDLNIDVVLDDGSGGADTVVISGTVSGETTINITNIGGAGGETAGDGILLVTTGGGTGTFVLPGELRAGDYLYSLVQIGNNWFLQSTFSPPTTPTTTEAIPALGAWATIALSSLLAFAGGLFSRHNGRKKLKMGDIGLH